MINNYDPGTILTSLHTISHLTLYLLKRAIQNSSIIYQILKYSMMFLLLFFFFSKSQFVLIHSNCWSSPVCGPWGLSTPCCHAIPITYFQTTNLSPPHQLSCSWPQSDNISCTMPWKTGLNISGETAQLREFPELWKSLLTLQYCINLSLHLLFFGSQGSLAKWTSSIQPQTETRSLLWAQGDLNLPIRWYSSWVNVAEWEPCFHDSRKTKILCNPELVFNFWLSPVGDAF